MRGRYELKYPITLQQKELVLEAAKHALIPDAHGTDALYRVSSMYFDTQDYMAFWEKLDGEEIRKKFRLRYYDLDESISGSASSGFMEIKHRINNTVYKERVRLTDAGTDLILNSPGELHRISDWVCKEDFGKKETIGKIQAAAQVPGFTGVNIITYIREAWEGRSDRRLRITFDSACRALKPSQYLQVATTAGYRFLPDNLFIMEVKFNSTIPRWIRDIINKYQLRLQRFSKYCTGLQAPNILPDLIRHRID